MRARSLHLAAGKSSRGDDTFRSSLHRPDLSDRFGGKPLRAGPAWCGRSRRIAHITNGGRSRGNSRRGTKSWSYLPNGYAQEVVGAEWAIKIGEGVLARLAQARQPDRRPYGIVAK